MTNDRLKGFTYGALAAAGHTDESEEAILCLEKDGYTSAGGNGTVVLFFFTFLVREL